MRAAPLLVLLFAAVPAGAQGIDVTGTWTCSMSVFRSGAEIDKGEEVFNIAFYRTGRFAASGRLPDGTPYSAEGDWKMGQARDGTFQIETAGKRLVPNGIPTPMEFQLDYVGPTELSSVRTEFGDTVSIDCSPFAG